MNGKKHTGRNFTKKEFTNSELDKTVSNDPSYYNKNKVNYDSATKVAWVHAAGLPVHLNDMFQEVGTSAPGKIRDYTVPGIMTIDVVTGPGYAATAHDAPNAAYSQLMADIYANTSASSVPFQQGDIAMYCASIDSISYLIAHVKRAIMSVSFWKERNAYYPIALLKAMGFDYTDLQQHMADYRTQLNEVIAKFNRLRVLDTFDIYRRHYAMFRNVYLDEDSEMGQVYIMRPANYYLYDDSVPKCSSMQIAYSSIRPFSQWITMIDDAMDRWFGSQDLYTIGGYLARAFQARVKYSISEVGESEMIEPVAEETWISTQIMNATVAPIDTASMDITQEMPSGNILWKPKTKVFLKSDARPEYAWTKGALLRAYEYDPDADFNMEATRLITLASEIKETDTPGSYQGEYAGCGPEIVIGIGVITLDFANGSSVENDLSSSFISMDVDDSGSNLYLRLMNSLKTQAFRYQPPLMLMWGNKDDTVANDKIAITIFGDMYNYTYLSYNQWRTLNRTALFSLYRITES